MVVVKKVRNNHEAPWSSLNTLHVVRKSVSNIDVVCAEITMYQYWPQECLNVLNKKYNKALLGTSTVAYLSSTRF